MDGPIYTNYGRKIIGIRLTRRIAYRLDEELTSLKVGELPELEGFERFNPAHAHIIGISWRDFGHDIYIGLTHPEFPWTSDGVLVPEFTMAEAKIKFPYLFGTSKTNPILWRDFGHGLHHHYFK